MTLRLEPGDVYGELVVLGEHHERDRKGRRMYFCRCSCGTFKPVLAQDLRRGSVKSCGHLRGNYPGNGAQSWRPVRGPDGIHPSVTSAAKAAGVTMKCMWERCNRPGSGWTYA